MSNETIIFDPRDGELVDDVSAQPAERLADVLLVVREREAALKAARGVLEGELRRRLRIRQRTTVTWGDFEVSAKPKKESAWDADELEQVLRELVDEGALHAGELTGVIRREVSRSKAKEVLGRLNGRARAAVEACCSWPEKPGPLSVTPVVQLPELTSEPEEAA